MMIPRWAQKAAVQKVISYLPGSSSINYLFQKYVTKGVYLSEEYFIDRLSHARDHLHYFGKYSHKNMPSSSLEIGTGWYPIVPIAFFLAGVDTMYSVDISMLTNKGRILTTIEKFLSLEQKGQLRSFIPVEKERFASLVSLADQYEKLELATILEYLRLQYLITDARALPLPDNSIDLVNSNNTFEHIYPDILFPILQEFLRVTKTEGGVMSHFIDMSDHFAHIDSSITIYNFLRFSPAAWKWIDNSIQPQNRMRYPEYVRLFEKAGAPLSYTSYREGSVQQLSRSTLDPYFARFSPEENAISHCHIVSHF